MTNEGTVSQLTFGQLSLWRSDQEIPPEKRPEWHFSRVWAVPAAATTGAVLTAVELLARRHESLRTTIDATPARPVQVIHPYTGAPVSVETADGTADAAWKVAEGLAAAPFDLTREHGWRAVVLTGPSGDPSHLCLAFHHLVADTGALEVLKSQFSTLAGARDPQQAAAELPPAVQPAELAAVQQSERWVPRTAAARQYWQVVLARYPRAGSAGGMSFGVGSGRSRATVTAPTFGAALARAATAHRVTVQAVMVAVLLEALERFTVRLAEPLVLMTSNRFDPRWRDLVGTQNQATMLAIPERREDFAEFVTAVEWACRTALRHGCYDFDDFTEQVTAAHGAPLAYDYFVNHSGIDAPEPAGEWSGPAPAEVDFGPSPQSTGPRLEIRVHGAPPVLDVRSSAELMSAEEAGRLVRWVYDRVNAIAVASGSAPAGPAGAGA